MTERVSHLRAQHDLIVARGSRLELDRRAGGSLAASDVARELSDELGKARPGQPVARPRAGRVARPRRRAPEAVLPHRQERLVVRASEEDGRERFGASRVEPVEQGRVLDVDSRQDRVRADSPRAKRLLVHGALGGHERLLENDLRQLAHAVGRVVATVSRGGDPLEKVLIRVLAHGDGRRRDLERGELRGVSDDQIAHRPRSRR